MQLNPCVLVIASLWLTDRQSLCIVYKLSCFHSLGRLSLKYVDLYLMHSPSGGETLETWDAMIQLKQEGKIRYSCYRGMHSSVYMVAVMMHQPCLYTHGRSRASAVYVQYCMVLMLVWSYSPLCISNITTVTSCLCEPDIILWVLAALPYQES